MKTGSPDKLGARLGPRLVNLFAKARRIADAEGSDMRVMEQVKATAFYWEQAEKELAGVFTGLFSSVAADPDVPDDVRASARILTGQTAQIGGNILSTMLGFAVGGAASAVFTPLLEPLRQKMWQLNDNAAIGPASAATATAQGLWSAQAGADESRKDGVSQDRFDILVGLAQSWPGVGEVIDLLNRGEVAEETATEWLRRGGLDAEAADAVLGLRRVLPSVGDIIRFAVREVYSPDVAQQFGQFDDFPTAAVGPAAQLGLDQDTLAQFWAAHWALPSPLQGFQMFHRGLIDLATLQLLMRALDVMPFWRDKLVGIAQTLPTRVDLRRMYRENIIDRPRVLRGYLDLGYPLADAENLSELAVAERTTDERSLAKSEIVALYEGGALTAAEAGEFLEDMGYGADEAEFILLIADSRRSRRLQSLAVSRVRSRFVGRRIDEGEAVTTLDRLGVPTDERQVLVEVWEAERDIDRPALSPAFVGALLRDLRIAEDDARLRWAQQGWRSADIDLLVLRYGDVADAVAAGGGPSRQLTKSDIGRALAEGAFSPIEATEQWVALGYSSADALLLVQLYLKGEEV